MMYINQSPFNLNDLIVSTSSTGPFQHNSTTAATAYGILPANNNCTTNASATATASYQANKNTNGYCFTQQSVNSNLSNNRSTSVSSTGSTSSVSSTASSNSSSNSSSPVASSSSISYNKLTNNNYNPYNFAYYNPTLTPTTTSTQYSAAAATTTPLKSNPFVSGTQILQNATAINGMAASGLGAINSNANLNSFSPLNEKFLYRPKSDIYQLNVLPQKNNSQFQYATPQSTASIVNNDSNSLLFNTLKTAQAKPNYYNSHYEPTIAYLPASTDLFFTTNPGVDQTAFSTSYLTPSFAYTTSATTAGLSQQQKLTHSKPLIQSIPFTATASSIGINIKKRKRRFKKPLELRKVLPKNSLMLLHEYRPNVEYRFVCQSGPIHRPIFTMCVEINEHKFEGEGKTKKEARMAAAEKAIEFLLQNPEYIQKPANHSTSSSLSSPSMCAQADQDSANTKHDLTDDEDNENENEHEHQNNDEDDDHEHDHEINEEKTKRFKSKETSQSLNDQTNLKCEQFQAEQVST